MQKNGAGLHAALSCHWDTVTDGEPLMSYLACLSTTQRLTNGLCATAGAHVVKWPSDKNKEHNRSMYCVVTVGGLSF